MVIFTDSADFQLAFYKPLHFCIKRYFGRKDRGVAEDCSKEEIQLRSRRAILQKGLFLRGAQDQ